VLRAILALPFIAAQTFVIGVLAVTCGILRLSAAGRRLGVAWGRAVLWTVGVGVEVCGAERCPSGPAVYAANHTSALDIPILFGHLPVDFRILHKRSLYLVPVLGLYLYVAGHVGIHRARAFRARKGLERAAARIRGGTSVAAFPEGTRSPEGTIGRFKRGSFLLALEAGVPVVPVSLCGVKRVAPGGLRVRRGRVRVLVHPPVATTGRDTGQAEALAEEVRRIVMAGCEAA